MDASEVDEMTDIKIVGNRIWTLLKEAGISVGEMDVHYGFRNVVFRAGPEACVENDFSYTFVEIRDKTVYKGKLKMKIFSFESLKEQDDDPTILFETNSSSKFILFLMRHFKKS